LGLVVAGGGCPAVFLADAPVDANEGAAGDQVLEVALPDSLDLGDFELVEEGESYREWCVPAAVINQLGTVRLLTDDDEIGETPFDSK
jgi:hypothetical protein